MTDRITQATLEIMGAATVDDLVAIFDRTLQPSKLLHGAGSPDAFPTVGPKIDFEAAATATKEELAAGKVKFVTYDPNMRNEAEAGYAKGVIRIGQAFFNLPDLKSKKHVLLHERSHYDAAKIGEAVAMQMADAGYFGPMNGGTITNGPNGQFSPDECLTESIALYQDDPTWLKERYPKAYAAVKSYAETGQISDEILAEIKAATDQRFAAAKAADQAVDDAFKVLVEIRDKTPEGPELDRVNGFVLEAFTERVISAEAQKLIEDYKKAPKQSTADPTVPADELDHGRVSYVATVKGASVRTAFKLIEANALVASNGLDGKPNAAYPQELQPRDRTRVASVMQITKLSRSLQPARLADSGLSSQGAPIIGPDRVVESGNGRSMAIIKAYAEGNASEYRQYLEDNAELYGFTTSQVKHMSAPVLVRVRLDEVDRAQFAKDSNVSDMQALSPTEQARIDAEAMDEGVMALFSPDASGDFLAASNRPFVSAFLAKLTSEQAAGLLTPDGRPTRQVIERIRAAVFAKAYQHEDLLRLAVEEPDPEIRNVLSALTTAAPQFVTMRTLSGEAHKQTTDTLAGGLTLTKTLDEEALAALVDATTIVRAARDAGQPVGEYLKQGDMFGGADPQAAALASFIAANNRSVKRMAEAFAAMADEICQILEHKGQVVADMFGEPPVDLVTVLARVNDHMAELYGEKAGIQVGMFDAVAADLPTRVRAARAARFVRDAESVGQVVALFDMMTSNKEGQFERDAGEFERQIRALSLSVITRPREEAITDAAIRHMNKQQVLAELDRNPEYQALTPAQREGLSDVMARSAGNIVDAGGFHYDIRTYEAVTAYIEQQRGQPGYQEAVSAAVSLYRHYVTLLRESGNKPLVQGVAPLRAMVDELTGVMPESEAAKMVAGTKVRISAASLAPGYDMAAMKSDMARFYQVVSGQMGTPELVRKKKRAYASLENNHINSGEGMTKTTLWHEMGHFVEYKHPELLLAAKQLLARRSDAIPSEKGKVAYLKHMTGVKSYKNEVAVNDGFYHPYVGKIYGAMGIQGVETTEVFSMGLQALATDVELAKLAMADPEHLAVVMAAIKMLGIKYKEAK